MDLGAKPDGKTLCTGLIQKAITIVRSPEVEQLLCQPVYLLRRTINLKKQCKFFILKMERFIIGKHKNRRL